jgi:hypothetical protein
MNIERLIQLNIELEGLLRVLANRDTQEVRKLVSNKYLEFKSEFETIESAPTEPAVTAAIQSEVHEPVDSSEVESMSCNDDPTEPEMPNAETKVEPTTNPHVDSAPIVQAHPDREFTTADEIAANRQIEMRVDEMLTRREARDLRKAFTLNDKFRFRRELFSNNDTLFADTLNLLSAMKNMDEATEYMSEDMGWDMGNDDVKDFVNIISNHFASV